MLILPSDRRTTTADRVNSTLAQTISYLLASMCTSCFCKGNLTELKGFSLSGCEKTDICLMYNGYDCYFKKKITIHTHTHTHILSIHTKFHGEEMCWSCFDACLDEGYLRLKECHSVLVLTAVRPRAALQSPCSLPNPPHSAQTWVAQHSSDR